MIGPLENTFHFMDLAPIYSSWKKMSPEHQYSFFGCIGCAFENEFDPRQAWTPEAEDLREKLMLYDEVTRENFIQSVAIGQDGIRTLKAVKGAKRADNKIKLSGDSLKATEVHLLGVYIACCDNGINLATTAEISERLSVHGVSKQSSSTILNQMCDLKSKAPWIARLENDADDEVKRFKITNAGYTMVNRILDFM